MTSLSDVQIIKLPKIPDNRGNLSFIESQTHIPLVMKRIYWIYDVPGGEIRGSHAFRKQSEFIVALSGSFDVVLNDGKNENKYSLNRSYSGLFVPPMIWRNIENFSANSLCMILSSEYFDENDYIRDYELFISEKGYSK